MQGYTGSTRPQSTAFRISLSLHSYIAILCSLLLALAGATFLPLDTGAAPADLAPSKPVSISATTGNQQVTLDWGISDGAESYQVNETDLATDEITRLPAVLPTTRATITGLDVGHWYRFSVTPFAGSTAGPESDPIEIRTTGFSGSYSNYYALGDSYTSGNGAPPYSGITGCYRSTSGYPYLLADGVPKPIMIACSGAVTNTIDRIVQKPTLQRTQLAQLRQEPRGNTLITLTIGGNDIDFLSDLTNCLFGTSSCTSRQSSIETKITALKPRLVQVYNEIRTVAPGADIIATGYPLLVADPSSASCHNLIVKAGLSSSEMTMIRTLVTELDGTIAQAAQQAGVFSITSGIEQAFAGHEACAAPQSQEWIHEIDDITDAFHPNPAGYQAYATAIDTARPALYASGMVRA